MDTMVLVCGSQRWADPQPVEARLDEILGRVGRDSMMVLHSDQTGAAHLAGEWAEAADVPHRKVAANTAQYGWEAFKVRNTDMLDTLLTARERGIAVEMAVFVAPGDTTADELEGLARTARGAGIHGTIVRAAIGPPRPPRDAVGAAAASGS